MKKSEPKSSFKYYDSIDFLPIINWQKIHETSDVSWLLISKRKPTRREQKKLSDTWEAIYNEYIKIFGLGDSFIRILEKRIQIEQLRLKMVYKQDPSIQTFVDVEREKLKLLENANNTSKQDIYRVKSSIEKVMGIRISMSETSVREFYSYLKYIQDGR